MTNWWSKAENVYLGAESEKRRVRSDALRDLVKQVFDWSIDPNSGVIRLTYKNDKTIFLTVVSDYYGKFSVLRVFRVDTYTGMKCKAYVSAAFDNSHDAGYELSRIREWKSFIPHGHVLEDLLHSYSGFVGYTFVESENDDD